MGREVRDTYSEHQDPLVKLIPLQLDGAYMIETELLSDSRGFFERTFCAKEFAEFDLNPCVAQCNISYNIRAGTLRGLHYQEAPHEEAKLIRCISGAVYDVIVDLRPQSATFRRWFGTDLSAYNRRMLYIPEGFAHGFQTLVDSTEILYQMSTFYVAASARGVRWDDPALSISWPKTQQRLVSERDLSFPLLT